MIPLKKKMLMGSTKGLPYVVPGTARTPAYPQAGNTLPVLNQLQAGDYLVLVQASTSGSSNFTPVGFTLVQQSSSTLSPKLRVFIREVEAVEPAYTYTSSGSGNIFMFAVRRSSGYTFTAVNRVTSGNITAPSVSIPVRGMAIGIFTSTQPSLLSAGFFPGYTPLVSFDIVNLVGSAFVGSLSLVSAITTDVSLRWFDPSGAKHGMQLVFNPEE